MRSSLLILLPIMILSGCHTSPPVRSTMTFGDGTGILEEALDSAFKGDTTQFLEVGWSGHSGTENFAVEDSFVVKSAKCADVFSKLDKLPAKRGWKSHGSGRSGDTHLGLSYLENSAQFYFDFLFIQQDQDVKVIVLHKGVQR